MGAEEVKEFFVKFLSSIHLNVVKAAEKGLKALGVREDADEFKRGYLEALKSSSPDVVINGVQHLASMGAEEAKESFVKLLSSIHLNVVKAAEKGLKALGVREDADEFKRGYL